MHKTKWQASKCWQTSHTDSDQSFSSSLPAFSWTCTAAGVPGRACCWVQASLRVLHHLPKALSSQYPQWEESELVGVGLESSDQRSLLCATISSLIWMGKEDWLEGSLWKTTVCILITLLSVPAEHDVAVMCLSFTELILIVQSLWRCDSVAGTKNSARPMHKEKNKETNAKRESLFLCLQIWKFQGKTLHF